jgi:hypothetical protein
MCCGEPLGVESSSPATRQGEGSGVGVWAGLWGGLAKGERLRLHIKLTLAVLLLAGPLAFVAILTL